MTISEIADEIDKCKNNPHYFATKYLTIESKKTNDKIPFKTLMSEEEFNNKVFEYDRKYKTIKL